MKKYLDKILGNPIKISTQIEDNKPSTILVQKKSQYASKLSFYKELNLLKEDSFIIRSEGENIIIAGVNQRALFYGVYHFLERYMGCKFLTGDFEISA